MEEFIAGDVVAVIFPFSDLSGQKLRPALVLANAEFGDLILCQITSKTYSSRLAIPVDSTDFKQGAVPLKSYVRIDKIFTAESSIVNKRVGRLKTGVLKKVLHKVRQQFR